MLLLALGFAIVVVGAGISGLLFELVGLDLITVEAVQAASQAAGFFVIVLSLMVSK